MCITNRMVALATTTMSPTANTIWLNICMSTVQVWKNFFVNLIATNFFRTIFLLVFFVRATAIDNNLCVGLINWFRFCFGKESFKSQIVVNSSLVVYNRGVFYRCRELCSKSKDLLTVITGRIYQVLNFISRTLNTSNDLCFWLCVCFVFHQFGLLRLWLSMNSR